MTWSDACAEARDLATERGIRYSVYAYRVNGRYLWYRAPVGGLAWLNHRRFQ